MIDGDDLFVVWLRCLFFSLHNILICICYSLMVLFVFEFMLFGVFAYLLAFFFPTTLLACFIILRQLHHCSNLIIGSTSNSFEVTS